MRISQDVNFAVNSQRYSVSSLERRLKEASWLVGK